MYAFGTIVLACFPFTDLSGNKMQPALVVSRRPNPDEDVTKCVITSVPRSGPAVAPLPLEPGTGLKRLSAVRFDKIATLHSGVIAGAIGAASAAWLVANTSRFAGVFGFGAVDDHGPAPNAG